ncbi:hypothetical protein K1F50_01975 [Muricauda oceani]|uniref:DUF4595 domain-containing protein n=1 Tax=Flagellimonas oceani TaxID=2698672 RepID=A0A6G7J100_9FLAO|nr:hypothetical protein [Allomuricauda oceani]MBW8241550.1 hypothetical protein [Allomuricauda oceani]QII44456.1 hypothetical protein GVT53_07135 [Allomuricauda oceani]
MKNHIILLFFVLNLSCSDNNSFSEEIENEEELSPEEPEEQGTAYLNQISSNISSSTENIFDFTDFNNLFSITADGLLQLWEIDYIENKSMIEIQVESGSIIKLTSTEFDKENESSTTEETIVSYNDDGLITRIETFYNGDKVQEYSIVHNLSEIDFIDLIDDRNRKVTLDSNNNLTSFYQENIDFTILFEYSDGNLIKKTLNEANILTYQYDDKSNPFNSDVFLNLSTIKCYLNVIGGWEFLFYDENNVFSNSNNIVQFTVEKNEFGGLQSNTFIYNYNEKGFPIEKSNENNSITVDYIYTTE